MRSSKNKKKMKAATAAGAKAPWRKKALEKTATPPINNLPGLLPNVQNQGKEALAAPSFRDVLMSRRMLQPQQQQVLAPNYIPQGSIGMDQYNRIRDQNTQKQQETIDYKKLIEEEKSKSKAIEVEMTELKKNLKGISKKQLM